MNKRPGTPYTVEQLKQIQMQHMMEQQNLVQQHQMMQQGYQKKKGCGCGKKKMMPGGPQ